MGHIMTEHWPAVPYDRWGATCDTLHAHTQVLGKLAVELAPPEPELQHAALRLTARGWETGSLPAADGSGSLVVTLDLHAHEAVVEHSRGSVRRVPLAPDRPVAEVTRDVLAAVARAGGAVRINPVPQEVPWSLPLDEDYEHARYDPGPVHAGQRVWGSFDLCVVMFSGAPADPPSDDFITRNTSDAQQVVVGWWPGDARHRAAAFYAFAYPAPPGFAGAALSPAAARWDEALGEYILDWDDVRAAPDPHAAAVDFLRSAYHHAYRKSGWSAELGATAEGMPPPIR
jgi:hypothetical protein